MVDKLKHPVVASAGAFYPAIALGVFLSPSGKHRLCPDHRTGKPSFQRPEKGVAALVQGTGQSRHAPRLTKMPLMQVGLGFAGVQTGVGYRERWNQRMSASARPAPEPQNLDQAVAMVLEVLRMPAPAVKVLTPRTGLQRKKNTNSQRIGLAVVLSGDLTV